MTNCSPIRTRLKGFVSWFLLVVVSFMALALLADPASAQHIVPAPGAGGGTTAWTIYGFGNAQAISDTMRAVNNFVASGTFRGIVSMLAVIGIVAVGASSGFSRMLARSFVSYSVFVLFVVYLLFGYGSGPVSVLVEVEDSVDGAWTAPVEVPAVVGIPAALISGAGQSLTRQIEASFPIPDSMKLSNGAPFNLAANMISDASHARIQDPYLAASLAYFVQDCFMIGAVRGTIPVGTLWTSTDFLTDIDPHLKSIYVNTFLGDPVGVAKLTTCSAGGSTDGMPAPAIDLIRNAVNDAGPGAGAFLTDASAWATTPALSVLNAAADDVASYVMNMPTGSGGAMVKQAAVLQAFAPAFRQAASATGNSDFLTGLAVTQATETQKNSWLVGAEVFNKMMGYVFAVLQVFIYALTPLILAASLIPSLGLSLLKNFSQVLLWLAMWQPMLAIVNFVVLSMQRSGLGGAFATAGASANNFALANIGIVSERAANLSAAATFIGTMVPVLAWVFVRGTIDFSRMVGSAVGENFAQQAGSTLTTGNFSLNQGSMDSFSANKTSISPISDFGNGMSVSGVEAMAMKHNQFNTQLNDGALVTATASMGTAMVDGSRTADQATHNAQSGHSVMGGSDYSAGESGSRGTSAGTSNTSGQATVVAGSLSGGVSPGGRGSGAANTSPSDLSSPGSMESRAPGAETYQTGQKGHFAKAKELFNPKLGASGQGTAQGMRSEQDQYGTSAGHASNFARNERGSDTWSSGTGDARSHSAGVSHDQTSSRNVTVTGAAADYGQILADRLNERSPGVSSAMDKLDKQYANEQSNLASWLSGAESHAVGFSSAWQDANGGDAFKQDFKNRDSAARGEATSPLPGAGTAGAMLETAKQAYGRERGAADNQIDGQKGKAQRGAASQFAGMASDAVMGTVHSAADALGFGQHLADGRKGHGGGHGNDSQSGTTGAPAQAHASAVIPAAPATPLVEPAQPAAAAPGSMSATQNEQIPPSAAPAYNVPIGVLGGEEGRQADQTQEARAAQAQNSQLEQVNRAMKRSGESASYSLDSVNMDKMTQENREAVERAKDHAAQVAKAH